MNLEFLEAIEALEREKHMSKDMLIEAIESALVSAYKKNYGTSQNVHVDIDRETGDINVFMRRDIVEEVEDPFSQASLEEAREKLINDFKIANRLGFKILRTKMGVINGELAPVENWREIIKSVLPEAEKYDVIMCPEIHLTTVLADQFVQDYVDFIEETGTKNFGLNIDLSVFQNRFDVPGVVVFNPDCKHSEPEEIIRLLPYVKCIHAKFNKMDDNFNELTIPYPEILKILVEQGWEGYLLSEYEGENKDVPGFVSQELRKQHVMMKRILGY